MYAILMCITMGEIIFKLIAEISRYWLWLSYFLYFHFLQKTKKNSAFFAQKQKKPKNIFILIFQLLHTVQIGVKFQNALKSIFLAKLHTTDQVAISSKRNICIKSIQIADFDRFFRWIFTFFSFFVFGLHFLQKNKRF